MMLNRHLFEGKIRDEKKRFNMLALVTRSVTNIWSSLRNCGETLSLVDDFTNDQKRLEFSVIESLSLQACCSFFCEINC